MYFTDEQKKLIKKWVEENCTLSEIQKRLKEIGVNITFMELRLALIDMGIELKDPKKSIKKEVILEDKPARSDERTFSGTGVSVEVDRVTKAGAYLSGSVKFSDGVKASWFVDALGRLAINPEKPGYTPSPFDIEKFQEELRNVLQKMGYA